MKEINFDLLYDFDYQWYEFMIHIKIVISIVMILSIVIFFLNLSMVKILSNKYSKLMFTFSVVCILLCLIATATQNIYMIFHDSQINRIDKWLKEEYEVKFKQQNSIRDYGFKYNNSSISLNNGTKISKGDLDDIV